MALNGDILGDAIRAAVETAVQNTREAGDAQRAAIWRAVGNAIVNHLTSSAVVTVTVPSVSGVTPGAGVSGPGVGTGSPIASTGGIT